MPENTTAEEEAQAYAEDKAATLILDDTTERLIRIAYLDGRIAGLEWAQRLIHDAA